MVSPASQKKMELKGRSAYCGSKVLSNGNLKPLRLKEHFDYRHGGAKSGNDFNTLKIKRARFHQSGTLEKHGFLPIDKPL